MNTKLPKKYQRWEKTRQKGMLKFILINGVLYWGLFMCAFINSYYYFRKGIFDLHFALVSCVIFLIGSIFYGYFTWRAHETSYENYKKDILNKD